MIRTLSILGLTALVSTATLAQTTVHYREGQRVDPQEVMRILGNAGQPGGKTRSIRLLDEPGSAAVKEASGPTELSLPVRFEFDSADISASARSQLDALAEGIKLLPLDQTVRVEGHTDAAGSDEYNRRLSQRRAVSVKQYLVQVHGIEARRLRETGLGELQPIDGADPFSPQNRRVQFRGG